MCFYVHCSHAIFGVINLTLYSYYNDAVLTYLISSTLEQNKLAGKNWSIVLVHTFLRINYIHFIIMHLLEIFTSIFTKRNRLRPCISLAWGQRPATSLKKETLAQVFSCEFCEISRSNFFYRTPLVAASVNFSKLLLTHLNLTVLSCKNQSIDLQWISLDWFLYDSKISLIG